MPTVKMPRADWESLLEMLNHISVHSVSPVQISIMKKEIEDQVYSQEY